MFQQPWQQATYYCSLILQDHSWPWMEQLEVLPDLKAETLSKFVPLMLSKAFLECYIAGWFFNKIFENKNILLLVLYWHHIQNFQETLSKVRLSQLLSELKVLFLSVQILFAGLFFLHNIRLKGL